MVPSRQTLFARGAMIRKYDVTVTVDNRVAKIQDEVDTNYRGGEIAQVVNLFYRTLLALDFAPGAACAALGKAAAAGGYMPGDEVDDNQTRFEFVLDKN